jgi:hypothetical protein
MRYTSRLSKNVLSLKINKDHANEGLGVTFIKSKENVSSSPILVSEIFEDSLFYGSMLTEGMKLTSINKTIICSELSVNEVLNILNEFDTSPAGFTLETSSPDGSKVNPWILAQRKKKVTVSMKDHVEKKKEAKEEEEIVVERIKKKGWVTSKRSRSSPTESPKLLPDDLVIGVTRKRKSQDLGLRFTRLQATRTELDEVSMSASVLVVSQILEGSPFLQTKLQRGMECIIINGTPCYSFDSAQNAYEMLEKAKGTITIVARKLHDIDVENLLPPRSKEPEYIAVVNTKKINKQKKIHDDGNAEPEVYIERNIKELDNEEVDAILSRPGEGVVEEEQARRVLSMEEQMRQMLQEEHGRSLERANIRVGVKSDKNTISKAVVRPTGEDSLYDEVEDDGLFQVTVTNKSKYTIKLFWDDGGEGVLTATLEASNEKYHLNTYKNHKFFALRDGAPENDLPYRFSISHSYEEFIIPEAEGVPIEVDVFNKSKYEADLFWDDGNAGVLQKVLKGSYGKYRVSTYYGHKFFAVRCGETFRFTVSYSNETIIIPEASTIPFEVALVNKKTHSVDILWDDGSDGVVVATLEANGAEGRANTYHDHSFFVTSHGSKEAFVDARTKRKLRFTSSYHNQVFFIPADATRRHPQQKLEATTPSVSTEANESQIRRVQLPLSREEMDTSTVAKLQEGEQKRRIVEQQIKTMEEDITRLEAASNARIRAEREAQERAEEERRQKELELAENARIRAERKAQEQAEEERRQKELELAENARIRAERKAQEQGEEERRQKELELAANARIRAERKAQEQAEEVRRQKELELAEIARIRAERKAREQAEEEKRKKELELAANTRIRTERKARERAEEETRKKELELVAHKDQVAHSKSDKLQFAGTPSTDQSNLKQLQQQRVSEEEKLVEAISSADLPTEVKQDGLSPQDKDSKIREGKSGRFGFLRRKKNDNNEEGKSKEAEEVAKDSTKINESEEVAKDSTNITESSNKDNEENSITDEEGRKKGRRRDKFLRKLFRTKKYADDDASEKELPATSDEDDDLSSLEESYRRVVDLEIKDAMGFRGTYTGIINIESGFPNGIGKIDYWIDDNCEMARYDGEWEDGCWDGYGSCVLKCGDSYEGLFQLHERHGEGEYIWKTEELEDGTKKERYYKGNFESNQRHGFGVFTWKTTLVDGKENLSMYKGMYHHGKRQGQGVYSTQRLKYSGEWFSDKYHGMGRLEVFGEFIHRGNWRNGNFVAKATVPPPFVLHSNASRRHIHKRHNMIAQLAQRGDEKRQNDETQEHIVATQVPFNSNTQPGRSHMRPALFSAEMLAGAAGGLKHHDNGEEAPPPVLQRTSKTKNMFDELNFVLKKRDEEMVPEKRPYEIVSMPRKKITRGKTTLPTVVINNPPPSVTSPKEEKNAVATRSKGPIPPVKPIFKVELKPVSTKPRPLLLIPSPNDPMQARKNLLGDITSGKKLRPTKINNENNVSKTSGASLLYGGRDSVNRGTIKKQTVMDELRSKLVLKNNN